MEHNQENDLTSGGMCRAGCGFYANAAFEGMCSKCFKDALKRRQPNSSPTGRISPAFTTTSTNTPSSGADLVSLATTQELKLTTSSVDTATPTVTIATGQGQDREKEDKDKAEGATGGAEASAGATASDSPGDKDKKPKKHRCHSCKKKVGLTGFECRCGGLFCSMHRYSDKHECTFNYRELAQMQIRKANPVCVGQKIQKI